LSTPPLLDLVDIHRRFEARGHAVDALQGVTLSVRRGETLGILGESGAGKTTLGRIVVGLDRPDRGRILINGTDVGGRGGSLQDRCLGSFQMVFQDPYASLNPRMTIGRQIGEVLRARGARDRREIHGHAARLLAMVDLDPGLIDSFPSQLSGGQRQRVAIARALAPNPSLIVADEPTSALDATTHLAILELLRRIQKETAVAYLFISHDIAAVAMMSDSVVVIQRGRVVEQGRARDMLLPMTEA
jgi:ABC-type glutathione transport system ATPase component